MPPFSRGGAVRAPSRAARSKSAPLSDPRIALSGSGGSASGNQYVAPEQCPEQYITNAGTDESGRPIYSCPFSGVIHVAVEGRPWSRTWWSPSGDSVVEWLPAAKAAFANSPDAMDERFDRDHAAWVISEQVRLAAEAAAAAAAAQGGGG